MPAYMRVYVFGNPCLDTSPLNHSPQLEEEFHRCKRPVWVSWRMDETYTYKGEWKFC